MNAHAQQPLMVKADDFRFNLLKGFCIVGVVGIHFGGSFVRSDNAWSSSFYVGLVVNQFFSFSVPAFIFLSGWLLQMAYGTRPLDWKAFYRRRLIKLGIPYLLVTVAYFVFFRKTWIIQQLTPENFLPRFLYYGIEPTLYFVPLIFQLYLLFPFLKALDDWMHARCTTKALCTAVVFVLGLFFVLHVGIGHLAYTGKISYHWLCLRFFAFWLFYFYAGMQFKRLFESFITGRGIALFALAALSIALILFLWDMYVVTDPARVGISYERAMLDFAYSRPEILPYNICIVFGMGTLLLTTWQFRMPFFEFAGKYSYHIYVWHIPVLLRIAWEKPEIIVLCTRYPELMIVLISFVAAMISFIISLTDRAYLLRYQTVISEFLLRLRSVAERC